MTVFFDVHANAKENLLNMNCSELWDVICSLEGTSNVFDGNDREELLIEAQRQVDNAYGRLNNDANKAKLFLIKIE
jgi:hypothetical protein